MIAEQRGVAAGGQRRNLRTWPRSPLTSEFALGAAVDSDQGADRIIRWSTTGAVIGVAAVAAEGVV